MVNISRDRFGKTRVAKGDRSGLGGQYAPDPQKLDAAKNNLHDLQSTVSGDVFTPNFNSVNNVAGYDRGFLFSAGLTGAEIIEYETRPPTGSAKTYNWEDVVVQDAEKTGYTNSYYPGFVVAEALAVTVSDKQNKKYGNLPADPQSRLEMLQEDGDKYYGVANIVLDNKDNVFSSATVDLAEKVARKVDFIGNRVCTPVVRNSNGEWDIDSDASQLLYAVKSDVSRAPSNLIERRNETIGRVSATASKYNTYETQGSARPVNEVNKVDRFRNENSRKPSSRLVGARIAKRLAEVELNNFDNNKPNPIVGVFVSRKRKTVREGLVLKLSHATQELNSAENE